MLQSRLTVRLATPSTSAVFSSVRPLKHPTCFGSSRARVVDQNTSHHRRRHAEKMRAVLPVFLALIASYHPRREHLDIAMCLRAAPLYTTGLRVLGLFVAM